MITLLIAWLLFLSVVSALTVLLALATYGRVKILAQSVQMLREAMQEYMGDAPNPVEVEDFKDSWNMCGDDSYETK